MTLKEQRDAAIKKQQALRDAAIADGNRAFTADEQGPSVPCHFLSL